MPSSAPTASTRRCGRASSALISPGSPAASAGAANGTTRWLGPHGHVVSYPVRRGELLNFVAHYDSDAWTGESWTQQAERAELIKSYAGWNEAVRRMFESGDNYFKWALYDRAPMDAWGKGRATLLGDAAHSMLPYLSQGSSMTLEDACMLAEEVTRTPSDLTESLRRTSGRACRAPAARSSDRALEQKKITSLRRWRDSGAICRPGCARVSVRTEHRTACPGFTITTSQICEPRRFAPLSRGESDNSLDYALSARRRPHFLSLLQSGSSSWPTRYSEPSPAHRATTHR